MEIIGYRVPKSLSSSIFRIRMTMDIGAKRTDLILFVSVLLRYLVAVIHDHLVGDLLIAKPVHSNL